MEYETPIARGGDDGSCCGPDLMRFIDSNAPSGDRRSKIRLSLSWKVCLTRHGETHGIEATTKNISSSGLYCIVAQAFVPGEAVHCVLLIPTFDPEVPDRRMSLDCQTRVVRVEFVGPGQYGVAFRIESYKVVVSPSGQKARAVSNGYSIHPPF
jgi:hypothetical protein